MNFWFVVMLKAANSTALLAVVQKPKMEANEAANLCKLENVAAVTSVWYTKTSAGTSRTVVLIAT